MRAWFKAVLAIVLIQRTLCNHQNVYFKVSTILLNKTNLQGLMILIFLPFSITCRALSLPSLGSPPPPQPMIPAPIARHSTSWVVNSHSPSPVTFGGGRWAASSLALSSAELLGQYWLSLASCSLRIYNDVTYVHRGTWHPSSLLIISGGDIEPFSHHLSFTSS